jgi:hypothetical protein
MSGLHVNWRGMMSPIIGSVSERLNGPRSLPFDLFCIASTAVGLNDYDLPYPAHGLRSDHFFESFLLPR